MLERENLREGKRVRQGGKEGGMQGERGGERVFAVPSLPALQSRPRRSCPLVRISAAGPAAAAAAAGGRSAHRWRR